MDKLWLLSELVKIDSSTVRNANVCIEKCANYLSVKGIRGQYYERNGVKSYVAIIGKGDKTLVLNGHVDVVSGKATQFSPFIKGNRFHGRGAADMKGGVVAMIEAFCQLSEAELNCKVMLQLVADEEVGGENGTKYLVEEGLAGDFVICCEPTNLAISTQAKGILRVDIKSEGVSAHGSRPWEGDNAIIKVMEDFCKISNLPQLKQSSKFYKGSSVNLAFLRGGDIYNRVPDEAVMGLDIRYIPELNPFEIVESIKESVQGQVVVKASEPGIRVADDCVFVSRLRDITKTIVPLSDVQLIGQHGTSDARFFSGKGIPAIEFGPSGSAWHGDHEYVEIDSLMHLEAILIEFAKSFNQ